MRWLRISLLSMMFVAAILFAGCAGIQDSKEINDYSGNESFQKGNVTTYFYHYEGCQYCEIVKPYIEYIYSEMDSDSIEFESCDVKKRDECSQASSELKEKIGLKVVPAIVVVANNTSKQFIGWKEACELGAYYEELGMELPEITCHGEDYSVQECVDCHIENELEPPSKFDCSCPQLN
ncbi:MAG: hypothetical protein R6U44_00465 [Archaeoglobaceae archaeon]